MIRGLRPLSVLLLGVWMAGAANAQSPRASTTGTPFERVPAVSPSKQSPSSTVSPGPTTATAPAATAPDTNAEEARLVFNFRYQPWKDVLEWFAEQADLSLVMEAPPAGTFNYRDSRSFTPSEAIDLLNGVLLTKGYTLVRRERMLMLINIEDGIPPNLIPTVAIEELDQRGRFELVSVVFRPKRMTPEDAEVEIKKLLGPQGSVVVLSKVGQLLVTDTAGRLRTIQGILKAVEEPESMLTDGVSAFPLQYATPDEAAKIVRQLLNIPTDQNATPDGSLRIAIDAGSNRILASGKAENVRRVGDIVKTLDMPIGGDLAANQSLQLEVYPVTEADPTTVLQVMQTLLAGRPDVRLTLDARSGNLVALGRQTDHATIRGTLEQMQGDGRLATTRLKNLRVLPLTGREAQDVLDQVEVLWPTMRKNKIRVVSPSAAISTMRLEGQQRSGAGSTPTPRPNVLKQPEMDVEAPDDLAPGADEGADPFDFEEVDDDTTSVIPRARFFLAQTRGRPSDENDAGSGFAADESPRDMPSIIVAPGSGGLVIASEDAEALDAFEELLTTLAGRASSTGNSPYTVFYLKYAKAQTIAELLSQMFAARTMSTAVPQVASGGQGQPPTPAQGSSTAVAIIPDARLNALFVNAAVTDLDTIEQLLRVLDQPDSPEDVQLTAPPRLIPVEYTSAEAVAGVVRQVYSDRMAQAGGGRPGAEEFMRMFQGGRGGDGGRRSSQQQETPRINIGVDTRTNSLVVSAPEPVFNEIKALVAELDQPGETAGAQSLSVVALKCADPATLQKTLAAITGGQVQASSTTSSASAPTAPGGSTPQATAGVPGQGGPQGGLDEEMRRRMEFFRSMREGGGRFGRGGGEGGRGDDGGRGGGRRGP